MQPVDNIDNEETIAAPTDSIVGSQPTPYPDSTPTAPESSTASLSPTSVPINNVNNNNSSAVANVVVNSAAATTKSTAQKPTASSVTELPQTGPTDDILRLAGAGSLVVASTAFGASRRELLKTVLRK